ncbi:MAG TPA: transposase [Prolixibacteraceae bacterium]|nr:transposase [Prolixibacteraceae bacterium]
MKQKYELDFENNSTASANLQLALLSSGFIIQSDHIEYKNSLILGLMGINNKISAGYAYYITLTIEEWIDVFSRPVYKHIIVDSLNYCIANKGMEVYCWCLMSNHLHLIACASEDGNLSDILRDFKKFTSKALIEAIKETRESRRDCLPAGQAGMLNLFWYAGKNNKKIKYFKVWQDGNDAQEIHTTAFLDEKMNYIHNNPVKAELVGRPEDYLYSSARDYAGEKGLVEMMMV